MPQFIDLTGKVFGKLTVIKISNRKGNGKRPATYWDCECECGKSKSIAINALRSGSTISCGCATRFKVKHNMCFTKEYRTWQGVKKRALGKESRYFQYVDKGIDPNWLMSFENFFEDMGIAPSDIHTIERKDNKRGYYKDNCVWATPKEQNRNYSLNRIITYNGITLCVTEWADKIGLPRHIIYQRLNREWDIERIFNTPISKKHSHRAK